MTLTYSLQGCSEPAPCEFPRRRRGGGVSPNYFPAETFTLERLTASCPVQETRKTVCEPSPCLPWSEPRELGGCIPNRHLLTHPPLPQIRERNCNSLSRLHGHCRARRRAGCWIRCRGSVSGYRPLGVVASQGLRKKLFSSTKFWGENSPKCQDPGQAGLIILSSLLKVGKFKLNLRPLFITLQGIVSYMYVTSLSSFTLLTGLHFLSQHTYFFLTELYVYSFTNYLKSFRE